MTLPTRRSFLKHTLAAAPAAGLFGLERAEAMEPVKRDYGSRMKLSIAGYSFRKEFQSDPPVMTLLEEFPKFAAEHGLDAIEPTTYYMPDPPSDEYLNRLKRNAFLLGLDISGTAIGNVFTHPPGEERDEQIATTKAWIDRAALLDAPCIRIFAGSVQKGTEEEQARKWAIECIEECCEYSGKKGIFLALENHGGIVRSAGQMLAIVKEVRSEWFGVNLDTGNVYSDDPYGELEAMAPYAVNVQVKVEINPGGRGKVPADLERVVGILKDAGYRGYVVLEYEAKEDARTAIPGYLRKLRELIAC